MKRINMKNIARITLALMALMMVSACSTTEESAFSDYDYEALEAGTSGYPVTDLINSY